MKTTKFKKFMALLLTGMMALSTFSGVALADDGSIDGEVKEEVAYEKENPYMLYHGSAGSLDYSYTTEYYWVTPYMPTFAKNSQSKPEYHTPVLFNMVNTSLIDSGETAEDGPYASSAVYCLDILTPTAGAMRGIAYRRINLEDTTYFKKADAEKVRAIVMNSFPRIMNMDVLAASVNTWLGVKEGEDPIVKGLTMAEALSATQTAIWITANSDECQVYEYCWADDTVTYRDVENRVVDMTVDPTPVTIEGTARPTEQTIRNIESLCKYLLALKPEVAEDNSISDNSLQDVVTSYVDNLDGTYDVTVSYNVVATIDDGDDLAITAKCGAVSKTYALTKAGADSITLTVDKLDAVTLEINGVQTSAGDVYLFDAEGDRKISQSMVGYDASPVAVHAEVTIAERVLNFHKTTSTDQGKKALEDVAFDVYLITEDVAGFAAGELTLPAKPGADYAADTRVHVKTVTTDAQGKAVVNLTERGFGDGIYLVIEQSNPAVVAPIDPFFVCVPMTNEEGTGYTYNINIEPKNTVVPGPEIFKDVTEIDNDDDSFDVNETHTWIIRTTIPADLATAKEYKITDVLDYRLNYGGNLQVKLGKADDAANTEEVILTKGTEYKVRTGKTDTDGKTVDKFVVFLTDAGMQKVAKAVGTNYEDYEIRVYFDAQINVNAAMGAVIPNQATLDYTNSFGYEFDEESDIPKVYTCGIHIFKYDAKTGAPLKGAEFKLAKEAVTEEEKAAAVSLVVGKGAVKDVVYVDFFATEEMSGAKVNVVTTPDDGKAVMYGLEDGTYYLVEIKAPAGYNLLSYPVAVTLNEESYWTGNIEGTEILETDKTIKVANSNTFVLPETGGIGTVIFTVSGGLMTLAGGSILALKKREENE